MNHEADGRDGVVYNPRGEWGYFDRGYKVLVVAPRDPHHGRIGVVTDTYNDGGDIVHRVTFGGCDDSSTANTGDYFTDELVSAQNGGRRMKQQVAEKD